MSKLLEESNNIIYDIQYVAGQLSVMANAYHDLGMNSAGKKCEELAAILDVIPNRLSEAVSQNINKSFLAAQQSSSNLFKAVLAMSGKFEMGDKVQLLEEVVVGPYGVIPKGSVGVYRGISDDIEKYHLFEMMGKFDFLETVYGVPNCYLGDINQFKVIREDN